MAHPVPQSMEVAPPPPRDSGTKFISLICPPGYVGDIIYRQMPTPRELPQQIPAPQAKAWMQKP